MMGDLLGNLIWGAKNGQYYVIGGGSLQVVIRWTCYFRHPQLRPEVVLEDSRCQRLIVMIGDSILEFGGGRSEAMMWVVSRLGVAGLPPPNPFIFNFFF
jgi:hypothetical protein